MELAIGRRLPRWLFSASAGRLLAETLVPGTGEQAASVGDDFEDPQWSYTYNLPKSSDDIDKKSRPPLGRANNRRWSESYASRPARLAPTRRHSRRRPAGSTGALLIRSLNTGVPNSPSGSSKQDDLVGNTAAGWARWCR